MNLLYRFFVLLSLLHLDAFCHENNNLNDMQCAAEATPLCDQNNPHSMNDQVVLSSLAKAQEETKHLIVALGYDSALAEAGSMKEFLKIYPDFTAEALVALARDYHSCSALNESFVNWWDKGIMASIPYAIPTFLSIQFSVMYYCSGMTQPHVVSPLVEHLGLAPLTEYDFKIIASFFAQVFSISLVLAVTTVVHTSAAIAYNLQNSPNSNSLLHGKTIALNSTIPLSSLAQTNSFVTCQLGSPDGPWVWLEDSYGNTIPGAWGKVTENSWSLGTVESPTSLKTRCAQALLKQYPDKKGKILPKDVLVFASTRLNKHPITHYVRIGENAYKLSDFLRRFYATFSPWPVY